MATHISHFAENCFWLQQFQFSITDLLLFPQYAVALNSELRESLIVSKSIIEIFNLSVDLPKDKFNMIVNIFHFHKVKIAGVKPGLHQCESISNTFGTYHNQGFVYLSTRHASGYIENRIGNLMNSTINRGSSGRVHVDID